ncbi:GNAT family N-acetyltransferase [Nonomuraea soli]|uniref:Ribosomal protein S18 acetylase RimI-like enzyme n=1 Tax=Nonomuraea soli TaxID=1032476 RepID=A0A7W0CF69_9ACTN|nr:GNAT family N-acetyltransferase [Nonomuraea soli]MBA2890068.1 ribosomal protein S18 acetylase RimI-like enzyme [Nonomuraea soli]
MISIERATNDDIDEFLRSAIALVAEDAGRHDPDATDLGWADRSGRAYAEGALSGRAYAEGALSGRAYAEGALSGDNVVLLARDGQTVVGHLVGRLVGPGNVHPIRGAELESIHVYPEHRGGGAGTLLAEAFLEWAARHGAVRASVTAYAANEAALRFYARHGFTARSVILDRPLP